MPLYMDTHQCIEGLTAEAVARAHEADVKTQAKYRVKYLRYWFDENTGKVFCLVEAPNKEAAIAGGNDPATTPGLWSMIGQSDAAERSDRALEWCFRHQVLLAWT
jgi:hypothetical protein